MGKSGSETTLKICCQVDIREICSGHVTLDKDAVRSWSQKCSPQQTYVFTGPFLENPLAAKFEGEVDEKKLLKFCNKLIS